MPKKIFLTFDYEVFLRRSGSINKCILKPTSLIIDNLQRNNIKAVFFIDILQLYMLRKVNQIDDYDILKNNILELLKNGHQVELHVHPHWIDAIYDKENKVAFVLNLFVCYAYFLQRISYVFCYSSIHWRKDDIAVQ